ncbi:MAG: AarF/ABC1/UbiB kinase family protein [Pseudomonadota bacterium]
MSKPLNTSPFGRFLRVGSLATRVTSSLALQNILNLARSGPMANLRRSENFVLNAMRVTEALGEMKGAAMKVGQILSVHEGMLPPEVCAVLQTLQQDAPSVPFATMRAVLEQGIPNGMAAFSEFSETPLAAASIGQVYRGRLQDGRDVAVKVQYPDIDRVVAADLKNLEKLSRAMVAMFVDIDFDPFWEELASRLLEELDYVQEAKNATRMSELYSDDPKILVPSVIPEFSGKRVLTMEYVGGINPNEACTDDYDMSLRNEWGVRQMAFVMRGLYEHRFLHADPNFGNFAFREDGSMVVYDHGCVTAVPDHTADGCAGVLAALLDQDMGALPDTLHALGVYDRKSGERVPMRVVEPIGKELMFMVRPEPYRFSSTSDLYETLFRDNGRYLTELSKLELPPELTFVNRTLSGLFGNLCRLKAEARWDQVLEPFVDRSR